MRFKSCSAHPPFYFVGVAYGDPLLAKIWTKKIPLIQPTASFAVQQTHPTGAVCSRLDALFYKTAQDEVTFYRDWHADDDKPSGELFGGSLVNLEPTLETYDPGDAAPWAWDLPSDLFQEQFEDWEEFHELLQRTDKM